MKVYGIFPAFTLVDFAADDERVLRCILSVTEIVVRSLRSCGDPFHFAVDWRDPGASPAVNQWHQEIAVPHLVSLSDEQDLRVRVRLAVDPWHPNGGAIRSVATCRAVTFGYDGQAFLCLRHEDEPPISPDHNLIDIEERPDLLSEADYFDGWTPRGLVGS